MGCKCHHYVILNVRSRGGMGGAKSPSNNKGTIRLYNVRGTLSETLSEKNPNMSSTVYVKHDMHVLLTVDICCHSLNTSDLVCEHAAITWHECAVSHAICGSVNMTN